MAASITRQTGFKMPISTGAVQKATFRTLARPKASFFTSHQRPSTAKGSIPSRATSIFRRRYGSSGYSDQGVSIMSIAWGIIGVNTAIFGGWQYAKSTSERNLAEKLFRNTFTSTEHVASGLWHTLLTCAFTHVAPQHFLFNMVSFHAFASILSRVPGVRAGHFVAVVLGSAVTASASWLYHSSRQRSGRQSYRRDVSCGASGIVMGLAATATCLVPMSPMLLFVIPMPLWVMTGLYFAADTFFLNSEGSRVGHAAHLGGAAFGGLFYLAMLRRLPMGVWPMITRKMR
ncbi:hypothetical protein MBLNU230_g5501t1 [Neophaeotheca triangularis]